jgi:glutamate synthase (NADPH/NADH) large chain
MSGGIAYVYDVNGVFPQNCNKEMVDLDSTLRGRRKGLAAILQKHYSVTGSTVAKFMLDDLENQLKNFIKVFPKDYKKVLTLRKSNAEVTGDTAHCDQY